MVEIERDAIILHEIVLCPFCGRDMWVDKAAGTLECLRDQFPPNDCPQAGFKFEIPRVELILTERGNPQVAAT